MKAITFRLRLLEPVLVSQAQSGEENSAIGLPFVPGSALRGALATRYLQSHPLADAAKDADFRRFFLGGTVCYLNAYLWREDTRLLPKPSSWFTEKDMADGEDATIHDWAVDPDQDLEQAKPPSGEFCLLQDTAVAVHKPERQVNVHITLEDPNRRGEGNQVYRYDALAAGQVLAGAILAADDVDLSEVEELLEPAEVFLGGAHLVGYGRARFEGVATEEEWQEVAPGHGPESGEVVVTLLSDVIVRGDNGQVGGDLSAALADAVGQSATPKPERAYQRLQSVAGFNRKWSLPLAQEWAIQAGSVFVYPAGAFDADGLAQGVAQGIGERRAEGFGRLAVNWQREPELQRRRFEKEEPDVPALSESSKAMARQMAERRLRALLDRKLAEVVNNTRLSHLPPNTQLSRVRVAVQRARHTGTMQPLTEHMSGLKAARQQFERARVDGGTSLLTWIEERATQLDVERQLLGSGVLPEVAGQAAELTEAMRVEYTARLVDGVMKKAVGENQRRKEGV